MNEQSIWEPVLPIQGRRVLLLLVLFWVMGTLAFWHWALQPSVWVSVPGTLFNLVLLIYITGIPAWPFYLFLRMRQVRANLPPPLNLRVAMVVTKAPSEPWSLVQRTLEAMLDQVPVHDTWLADEQPTDHVRQWCDRHGVRLSSRAGIPAYHHDSWPRRTRCKEGNLSYFYDHYGYADYDVVVQLDPDHVPQPGYLEAMLQPFNDPQIGYVAAPSICCANAHRSWVARGRLFAESILHGPMQLGLNHGWAPLCFGSHYAVRTRALQQAGGLGPELAEDHSTTLMLNAKGWRGAFAHRAICHGLGPETFEDAMVQEFQWSRSLTIILLRYLPKLIGDLPLRLRLQFLYSEAFYPLRGSLSCLALALPVVALMLDRPWMRVNYPLFLLFSGLQIALTVLPMVYLRSQGLLRPVTAPPWSWEHWLFEMSRGPWVLAGVLSAICHWIRPRPHHFRVTKKQAIHAPLPLRFLFPYVFAVVVGVTATSWLAQTTRLAIGYVFLTLLATALFALTACAVAWLSHRQWHGPFPAHRPHLLVGVGAIALTVVCGVWLMPYLAVPFQQSTASLILFP